MKRLFAVLLCFVAGSSLACQCVFHEFNSASARNAELALLVRVVSTRMEPDSSVLATGEIEVLRVIRGTPKPTTQIRFVTGFCCATHIDVGDTYVVFGNALDVIDLSIGNTLFAANAVVRPQDILREIERFLSSDTALPDELIRYSERRLHGLSTSPPPADQECRPAPDPSDASSRPEHQSARDGTWPVAYHAAASHPWYRPSTRSRRMGTWAVHSFGNDDAADWLLELEEQDDLALVRGVIAEVLETDDYLELTCAAQALAAIEVVAATLGKPTAAARGEKALMSWVNQAHLHPEPSLIAAAVRAIDRIVAGESELRELWQDSPDFAAWQANVAELRAKLA